MVKGYDHDDVLHLSNVSLNLPAQATLALSNGFPDFSSSLQFSPHYSQILMSTSLICGPTAFQPTGRWTRPHEFEDWRPQTMQWQGLDIALRFPIPVQNRLLPKWASNQLCCCWGQTAFHRNMEPSSLWSCTGRRSNSQPLHTLAQTAVTGSSPCPSIRTEVCFDGDTSQPQLVQWQR